MWNVVALAAAGCVIQALLTASMGLAAGSGGRREELSGIVTDALQTPLGGVDLLLQRIDGHLVGARSTSDQAGHFRFMNIPPGTYAVVANKAGFATAASMVLVSPGGGQRLVISMAAQGALNRGPEYSNFNWYAKGLLLIRQQLSSSYRYREQGVGRGDQEWLG